MANAVIQFHPDGFDTSARRLMGRQSAGESFVRGFMRHAEVDRFYFWNWGALPVPDLESLVRRIHPTDKPLDWIERSGVGRFAEAGCLFCPSPGNATEAWNRRTVGPNRYSICGVTHTTCSAGVMDALANMMLAPVEPWDALICTSRSVEASVNRQFNLLAEYLKDRFAPTRWPTLRLQTIPLGVNVGDFARNEEARARLRDRLGAAEDDIVVLYVGRFSYHGKMHPIPMAMALEKAAKASGRKVHWVWAGWANNEHIHAAMDDALHRHAPSVALHILDGRDPDIRFPIWSAGDVFFSLSDNIQETFGLTPVEAMAAGLPCVISDWDGYRDTVRHEVDGFRVPTRMPRPGMAVDLAFQYANDWITYDYYIGRTSQFVAVDIEAAAAALARLFEDADLRARMGKAGQERARTVFDWSQVIPRYQALWSELGEVRRAAAPKPTNFMNPWRPDPLNLFAAYPTQPVTPDTLVTLGEGTSLESVEALLAEGVVSFVVGYIPSVSEIEAILFRLAEGPATLADLLALFLPRRHGIIERGVSFLAKYGCVTLSPLPPVQMG